MAAKTEASSQIQPTVSPTVGDHFLALWVVTKLLTRLALRAAVWLIGGLLIAAYLNFPLGMAILVWPFAGAIFGAKKGGGDKKQ